MPETRRDLFKTSVITALGGLAGALAGCTPEGFTKLPPPPVPPAVGSVVALYGQTTVNGKTTQLWYFFKVDNDDASKCVLSTAPAGTKFPYIGPTPNNGPLSTNAVDALSWYSSLNSAHQLSPVANAKNLKITYSSGAKWIIVTTSNSGELDPTSLTNFVAAIKQDMNQIPGSWNEIGHN